MTDDDPRPGPAEVRPRPSPAELLLTAVDALPEEDRGSVLLWLIDPSPRTPRGAWMLRSYTQALAARLPELRPLTREHLLGFDADAPTADDVGGEQLQMVPIRLTSDQHRRLRGWCAEHNFAMATVIRGLVDRFLESQGLGRPTPEADHSPDTDDPMPPP